MKSAMFAIPLLLLAATAEARSAKADIDAVNQKFGAAYAKGDAAAISRLYTEHATILPPGSDMVTGRDGIQKVWAGMIRSGLRITSLRTVAVEQYGNAAREIGRFTGEMPDARKQAVTLSGKASFLMPRKRTSIP